MKQRILALTLALVLLTVPLASCTPAVSERVLWHMDTAITVRLYGESETCEHILDECDDMLALLDSQLSATAPKSPITQFNHSTDGRDAVLPEQAVALIAKAIELSKATGGAFDITTAPLSALWQACEASDTLPDENALAAALACVGYEHLELTEHGLAKSAPDVRIDLGGIGKGYAIDRLLEHLRESDAVHAALISFGSNVAVLGSKPDGTPWRVAIRNPNAADLVGYVHLTEGQILSVSGDYERYFTIGGKQYSHILDPATGSPPENGLRSVAVLCPDGATADALSTALMVMGEDAARALYESGNLDFEAIFIYDDRVSTTDEDIWAK